jgi:hypothetical protein
MIYGNPVEMVSVCTDRALQYDLAIFFNMLLCYGAVNFKNIHIPQRKTNRFCTEVELGPEVTDLSSGNIWC